MAGRTAKRSGRSGLLAFCFAFAAVGCGSYHPRVTPRVAPSGAGEGLPRPAAAAEQEGSREPEATRAEPRSFHGRGFVVCLVEEIERIHRAAVDSRHAHVFALRAGEGDEARYYPLLPTEQAKALFLDERLRRYELILSGVVYPQGDVLDVSGFRGVRDGTLLDVYYWCEVCSIRGIDPGACACCQGEVILNEKELGEVKR